MPALPPTLLRLAPWLLAAALLAGMLLRIHGVFGLKHSLSHDESVTLLCAAATEGRYQEEIDGLLDRPLTVADIHAFTDPPKGLALRTVARDLVQHDTHPPLYFWMLHAIHHTVGLRTWTAPLLNILLSLGMLILLISAGKRMMGGLLPALVVAAVWYLSPAVLPIDLEGRHYALFGLLALASMLLAEGWSSSEPRRWWLPAYTLVNAAGLLTHYYFAFLLIPAFFLTWARLGMGTRLLRFMLSLVASATLFLVLFPEVLDFWEVLQGREPAAPRTFMDRFRTLVYGSLGYLAEGHRARYIALVAVGGLAVIGPLMAGTQALTGMMDVRRPDGWNLVHGGWAFAFTAGLYLAGIAPAQAVGEQYFVYIWPLLALVLVRFFSLVLPAGMAPWAVFVVTLHLLMQSSQAVPRSPYVRDVLPRDQLALMAGSDLVVTDDWKRGQLPRLALHLPGAQPLFLLHKERPSLRTERSIAFLHIAREADEHPWIAELKAQGWQLEQHELARHTLVLARR